MNQEPQQIHARYMATRKHGVLACYWDFIEQKRSFYIVATVNEHGGVGEIVNHNIGETGILDLRTMNRILFTLLVNARNDIGQDTVFESDEEWYSLDEEHSPESIFARAVVAVKR